MAGSYQTFDRLARQLAGEMQPTADEQLAALEARFARYTSSTENQIRLLRERLQEFLTRLEISEAANRSLVKEIRSWRAAARRKKPEPLPDCKDSE